MESSIDDLEKRRNSSQRSEMYFVNPSLDSPRSALVLKQNCGVNDGVRDGSVMVRWRWAWGVLLWTSTPVDWLEVFHKNPASLVVRGDVFVIQMRRADYLHGGAIAQQRLEVVLC